MIPLISWLWIKQNKTNKKTCQIMAKRYRYTVSLHLWYNILHVLLILNGYRLLSDSVGLSVIFAPPPLRLPKNRWQGCATTNRSPLSDRLSLNDPLFSFHILLSSDDLISKTLSHWMTPILGNICSQSHWMTPRSQKKKKKKMFKTLNEPHFLPKMLSLNDWHFQK